MDIWLAPNSTSRALPVLSLFNEKTIVIDKYKNFTVDISKINEHYYSDKAPLSTFLVYPFYYIYKKLGLPEIQKSTLEKYPIYIWEDAGMKDGRAFLLPELSTVFILGGMITSSIPFLLILLISFLCIRKKSGFSLVLLVMLTFYSSFMFVYSGVLSGHLLAGLFLFLSYLLLKSKRNYLVAGLSIGLALATEYPIAILIPIWILQIWFNEKNIKKPLLFISGILPGALFVVYYNYLITGAFFTTQYSYVTNQEYQHVSNLGFGMPSLESLWGLLFTQFRGLFFYIPLLAFFLFYLIKSNRQHINNFFKYKKESYINHWLGNYLLSSFIFYLLLISAHKMWTGGWSYGPRHLIPMAFLLVYEGIVFLSKNKFSKYTFLVLSAIGIIASWMAKSTKLYMIPDYPIYPKPFFDIILPNFSAEKFNSNNIFTLFFDASPQIANWLWLFIFILSLWILHQWQNSLYPIKIIQPKKPIVQAKKQKTKKVK